MSLGPTPACLPVTAVSWLFPLFIFIFASANVLLIVAVVFVVVTIIVAFFLSVAIFCLLCRLPFSVWLDAPLPSFPVCHYSLLTPAPLPASCPVVCQLLPSRGTAGAAPSLPPLLL